MRPWTKPIVRYSDVILFATYQMQQDESYLWEISADYRGGLTNPVDINNYVQSKIDALPASVQNKIDTLNTQQGIDVIAERISYYSNNPKRGLEIENIPIDEIVYNILPL